MLGYCWKCVCVCVCVCICVYVRFGQGLAWWRWWWSGFHSTCVQSLDCGPMKGAKAHWAVPWPIFVPTRLTLHAHTHTRSHTQTYIKECAQFRGSLHSRWPHCLRAEWRCYFRRKRWASIAASRGLMGWASWPRRLTGGTLPKCLLLRKFLVSWIVFFSSANKSCCLM